MGFLGGSVVKNPPANAWDVGLIPGSGRPPGVGNGNPFRNPTDRGAWQDTVHGVTKWVRQDLVTITKTTDLDKISWRGKCLGMCVCMLSHVWTLFATPWTVALQAPLSMVFSKQEYWSCHFLLHGIFPTQGSNPCLMHWQVDSLPLSHQGSLLVTTVS